MPIKELSTLTDLQLILSPSNYNPLGKIVVYVYEEGSPNHTEMKATLELISRECPHSQFYCTSMEILNMADDSNEIDFVESLGIFAYPVFIVRGRDQRNVLQISTRINLVNSMKKVGVLKEEANISLQ